jgi:hypothetical protein
MNYNVIWLPDAERELTDLWLHSPDRGIVTKAAAVIDRLWRETLSTKANLGQTISASSLPRLLPSSTASVPTSGKLPFSTFGAFAPHEHDLKWVACGSVAVSGPLSPYHLVTKPRGWAEDGRQPS